MAETAKEQIYDDQIFPLIGKVIDICKEHKIAFLADFALGFSDGNLSSQLRCTSCLLAEEFEPTKEQQKALAVLLGER